MSLLHKEYLKIGDNEIKFSITFNREKINWATSQPKKIGYQVTATPVKRTQREGYSMEETGAFTGFNDCLLEVIYWEHPEHGVEMDPVTGDILGMRLGKCPEYSDRRGDWKATGEEERKAWKP